MNSTYLQWGLAYGIVNLNALWKKLQSKKPWVFVQITSLSMVRFSSNKNQMIDIFSRM
jgi:hypothetical protein